MRILYAGTPAIAVPCLEALSEMELAGEGVILAGVLTNPDAVRRHGRPEPSDVSAAAARLDAGRMERGLAPIVQLKPAKLDSRERIAAPLFGMILSPGTGNSLSSTYLVKKIVRGSIADEAGISDQDPISIRGFRIFEDEGYALMDINIKKRSMGYMETYMQLPAWLDSPDTL